MSYDRQPANGSGHRPPNGADPSRRQWLAALGRWLVLTALAAISALLLRRGGAASFRCRNVGCRDCAALNRCGLPAAVDWRRTLAADP